MNLPQARTHLGNGNVKMAAVETLPTKVFEAIYPHTLTRQEARWQLEYQGRRWALPRAKDALRITHIGDDPEHRVLLKYLRGDIGVSPGDYVVDVGAMFGEFGRQIATDNVLAIEPDPRNVECLRHNINGDVVQAAAWKDNCELEIEMGENSSESSVFNLDSGRGRRRPVDAVRVDGLVKQPVDLLKVEAEGAEPEVLRGAEHMEARQVVVDVSAERHGESPAAQCRAILEDRGYDVRRYDDILTATMEATE